MSQEIRNARREDAPMLAEVVMLASRSHVDTGFWDLMIPSSEADRMRAIDSLLVNEEPSWCHYSNFLIAEVGGRPAAALSGYAANDASLVPIEQALISSLKAIGFDDEAVGEAFKRLLVFMTCHSEDVPDTWIVEWVATLADSRRRGLVRVLLLEILERGRERGHDLAQIGILAGNVSAQRAYEGVGFVFDHEKTDPEFEAAIGAPGLARLLREY